MAVFAPTAAKDAPLEGELVSGLASSQSREDGHTTPGVEKETYTLSDRTSTLVQTTGQIPPPLIGSTSIIHNNHLYLFGGRPQGKDPTNNLYILNMDTLVWTLVDQEQLANDWASSHHEEDERRSSPIVDTVFRRKSRVHPLSIYILPTEKVSTESSKIGKHYSKPDGPYIERPPTVAV
ncbi:hypothetical protein BGX27_010944 [Mortierella sp. AM989]|nr:hypothetical protein BGX27_010944 [Mortierella sp. AM989]